MLAGAELYVYFLRLMVGGQGEATPERHPCSEHEKKVVDGVVRNRRFGHVKEQSDQEIDQQHVEELDGDMIFGSAAQPPEPQYDNREAAHEKKVLR